MKKIVIIGPAYPYRGGQSLVEAHLFHILSREKYDCYTISYSLLYPSIFFPGTSQYDKSGIVYFPHSEKIFRLINSINPISWIHAFQKIREIRPDLLIVVWWMPFFGPALGTLSSFVKKKLGIKIIFLIENYLSHEKRFFNKVLAKYALKNADFFIAQSKHMKVNIEKDYPSKKIYLTTLPIFNCFNHDKFNTDSAREYLNIHAENLILYFGYIRPYKGLQNLISAFAELIKERDDTKLLIVGECYEDPEIYKKQILELKIEDKVHFKNEFISNEQVEPYFKAADFICLPYNSASQSGIIMIAYGFGKPVVVTDVGGLPELVVEGKTGFIAERNNQKSLLLAIRKMLADKAPKRYANEIKNLNKNLGYGSIKEIVNDMLNH